MLEVFSIDVDDHKEDKDEAIKYLDSEMHRWYFEEEGKIKIVEMKHTLFEVYDTDEGEDVWIGVLSVEYEKMEEIDNE